VRSSCGSEQEEARFGGECPNYAACTHKGCYVAVRSAGSQCALLVSKTLRYRFCSSSVRPKRDVIPCIEEALACVGEGAVENGRTRARTQKPKCAKVEFQFFFGDRSDPRLYVETGKEERPLFHFFYNLSGTRLFHTKFPVLRFYL